MRNTHLNKELEEISSGSAKSCRDRRQPRTGGEHCFSLALEAGPGVGGWLQPGAAGASHQAFGSAAASTSRSSASSRNTRQFLEARPATIVLLTARAGHRQVLDREGAAQQVRKTEPAADRGGEERPHRPAADRRPGRRPRERFCFSAMTSRSTRRGRLYRPQVALDGSISPPRRHADLRHLETAAT